MSHPSIPAGDGTWGRLPAWLRPRTVELEGSGRLRLIETTLLVLLAVFLATATVNDVARQTIVNHRLIADLKTWRHYTGHDYHDLSTDQVLFGAGSQREVVCGNTSAAPPKTKTQICVAIWGPVVDGLRTVHGGWYLPPESEDSRAERYGCFGGGSRGICPR